MGIESGGNTPKLPPSARVTLAGVKLGVSPTARLGGPPATAPLGRDVGALEAKPTQGVDPLASYQASGTPGASLETLGAIAAPAADMPKIQGSLKEFLAEFQALVKDDTLSPQDQATLEARVAGMAGRDFRTWARQALDDVKQHSTRGPDGTLTPRNAIVKAIIQPERLNAIAERLAQARSHPILDTIADPAAREQTREFLKRYMTDPVFLAVHAERTLNWGPWNNLKQSVGSLFADRSIGDNSVDGLFGGCVECQARMRAMFQRYEADWKADPANAGKTLQVSLGDMQTRNAVGFEHNFAFLKAAGGETLYLDPWGAQDTTKATIRSKQEWLDDMKDGAFGLVLGEGNITWVYEGGQEVYDPSDSAMAL